MSNPAFLACLNLAPIPSAKPLRAKVHFLAGGDEEASFDLERHEDCPVMQALRQSSIGLTITQLSRLLGCSERRVGHILAEREREEIAFGSPKGQAAPRVWSDRRYLARLPAEQRKNDVQRNQTTAQRDVKILAACIESRLRRIPYAWIADKFALARLAVAQAAARLEKKGLARRVRMGRDAYLEVIQ